MKEEIVIEINFMLSIYFSQEDISLKEQSILELFYPQLTEKPCDIVQAVYFILEYREVQIQCDSYEKIILDKLVAEHKCALQPLPDFKSHNHSLLMGVVD